MKKLILILLGLIAIAFAISTAAHADCDQIDPGNPPDQFE
jgi:hypothetical protein